SLLEVQPHIPRSRYSGVRWLIPTSTSIAPCSGMEGPASTTFAVKSRGPLLHSCWLPAQHFLKVRASSPPKALGPNAPCTSFLSNPCVSGGVGSDIFNAWMNLPGGPQGTNAARMSVARGQDIFNNKTLHVPADLQAQLGSASIHCTTCHQTKNVGNNPSG